MTQNSSSGTDGLRLAIEYAAQMTHQREWDSDNPDDHRSEAWQDCVGWPCRPLATHITTEDDIEDMTWRSGPSPARQRTARRN